MSRVYTRNGKVLTVSGKALAPVQTTVTIGGREYGTVKAGNMTWLSENLELLCDGIELSNKYTDSPAAFRSDVYGLLYNWHAVRVLQSKRDELFPGWHVCTGTDYTHLGEYIYPGFNVVTMQGLKEVSLALRSTTGWADSVGPGLDTYGVCIKPSWNAYTRAWLWTYGKIWDYDGTKYGSAVWFTASTGGGYQDAQSYMTVRLVKD